MITEEDFGRDMQECWRSGRKIVKTQHNAKEEDIMGEQMRWLKHRLNGRVFQYTDILAAYEEMLECDKDGNVLTMKPRTIQRDKERLVVKDGQTIIDSVRPDTVIVRPGEDLSKMTLEERITICRDIEELIVIAASLDVGIPGNMSVQEAKQNLIDMLPDIRKRSEEEAKAKKDAREKRMAQEKADSKKKTTKPEPAKQPDIGQEISACENIDQLSAIAARFDVSFSANMDLTAAKQSLVAYLVKTTAPKKKSAKKAAKRKEAVPPATAP